LDDDDDAAADDGVRTKMSVFVLPVSK